MNIITLGPIGTFSYFLTKKSFPNATIECVSTIESIFEHLEEYDKAVVPLENNVSGFVEQTVEHLMTCPYTAEQLIEISVRYNLVGFGPLEVIHTLFVFPYTYMQCKSKLKAALPKGEIIYTSSNGMSALKLAEAKSEGYAAVVPSYTDPSVTFPVLQKEVQDCDTNTTRFLVLSKQGVKPTEKKIYFLFTKKSMENLQADFQKREIVTILCKEVPMEGISCLCYFVVTTASSTLLEGYDTKLLGYLHENN